MAESLIAVFVTFFVVVDPIGVAPLFAALTPGNTAAERRRIALKGTVIGGGVLLFFALVGESFLSALGIGLPAFRIAGGILLLLLAIDMVMARPSGLRSTTPGEDRESGRRDDVSVFPLAIPLIARPGAITSVVLLMGAAHGDPMQQGAIVAVLLTVVLLTLLCLVAAARLVRLLGVTGINVLSRVLGIVTAALAVQFMIDGARAVWPGV